VRAKDEPLPKNKVELSGVNVAYTDAGEGEPILFVHGIPTSSYLWRNVIRGLDKEFRCIAPDLMGLGDTETPLDHRYDMEAQADKLVELMDRLEIQTFTLVCHDQGGAAAQWLAVNNKDRIARFIITNCVCYDNWPVPIVANFMRMLKIGPLARFNYYINFSRFWGPSPIGMRLGTYNRKNLSTDAINEYLKFSRGSFQKYQQFIRFALAGDNKYSVEAAKKFGEFDRPTCVIWAGNDRWLNVSWGRKLYDDIAGSRRMEVIPFAGHFWQEEKPELGAKYIREFMREG
jgi:pimeloyl-ACP methyl ester carboxylesterase